MDNTPPSVEFNKDNGNFEISLTESESKKEFKFISNKSEIKDDEENVYYLMTNENFNTLIMSLSKELIKSIEDKFILTRLQFENLIDKITKIINNGFSTSNSKKSCTDTLESLISYKKITEKSLMMTERRNLINYECTEEYIKKYNEQRKKWKNHRRFAVSKTNDKKPICFGPRADFKTKNNPKSICSSRFGADYTSKKYKSNTIFEHASFGLDNTSNNQKNGKGNFSDHKGTRIVNMGRYWDSGVDLTDIDFSEMLKRNYKITGGYYTTKCSGKSSANPGGNCYNFEKYVLGRDGYDRTSRNCNKNKGTAGESSGTPPFATPLCSLTDLAIYKKASGDAYSYIANKYEEYFVNGFMVRPVKNTYNVYEPRMEIHVSASFAINLNQTCCGVNMSNMDVTKMGDVKMNCSANQDITKNTTTPKPNTTPKPKDSTDSSSNTTIIILSVIGVVFFLALLFIILM